MVFASKFTVLVDVIWYMIQIAYILHYILGSYDTDFFELFNN
jgi:hypothetical protein